MDAYLGGGNLIRFWASGGNAFNSNMATKILHFSYLGDYLSYRLEIWHEDPLYPKDKVDKFWSPGGAVFNSKMATKLLHFPYLGDYSSYRLEIWHKDPLCPKDKINKFWSPGWIS